MTKKQLVTLLTERVRGGRHDRSMTKRDVEAVIDELGKVILEEVILRGDRVALPDFGCAHAEWLGTGVKTRLYAQFDWAKAAERRILEARP